MTEGTVCILIKNSTILMKYANRGISSGKWNFPGGKMEYGETKEQCAIRETYEETGLKISDLFYHGRVNFFFEGRSDKNWIVHIFSSIKFNGQIMEGEEGKLEWVDIDNLPKQQMWAGDKIWLPYVLENKKFDGEIYYNSDGSEILNSNVEVAK